MRGIMQAQSLLLHRLIDHADRYHGETEIVSRRVEGDIHRTNWSGIAGRSRQVANALDRLGVAAGERVATLAWNGYRHLETYFGVSGSQRVLHTLNPRLVPAQLAWIINHAEDAVVCFDMTFLPLIQAVHAQCPSVTHWVAYCDADKLPADTAIPNLYAYEALLSTESSTYALPEFDEGSASSLCYTSGTTGNPKGGDVQPPLYKPSRHGIGFSGLPQLGGNGCGVARRPHVPRERLGDSLCRSGGWFQAGFPGSRDGRRVDL